MSDDEAPKSALELAMARLQKKDRDEGVEEERPLTEEQRAAIGEARKVCEARLAEREILHQSALRKAADPESAATLDDEYRRDRERFLYDRDRKIEEIRRRD
jgi:hypothetical protein